MDICLIQTDTEPGELNLRLAIQIIRTYNADLYVLPELFMFGFRLATSTPGAFALPLANTHIQTLGSALVARPDATIIAGFPERESDRIRHL